MDLVFAVLVFALVWMFVVTPLIGWWIDSHEGYWGGLGLGFCFQAVIAGVILFIVAVVWAGDVIFTYLGAA